MNSGSTDRGAEPDEVDQIVQAWRRERPDLDVAPLEVLSRVTRLARHLDRARAEAFADHDLSGWEFDVLAALRRAGQPYLMTAGALVASTMVTSGTMTTRVDKLTERGLVRRLPDPDDGRGVLVQLTTRGQGSVDAALDDLLERERHLLGALSPDESDALAVVLRQLLVPFEQS